jgi:hypothetical protein
MTHNKENNNLNFIENKFILFSTYKEDTQRFKSKKLQSYDLLEENENKKMGIINTGRWKKEEHQKFISACLEHGPNWKKVLTFF